MTRFFAAQNKLIFIGQLVVLNFLMTFLSSLIANERPYCRVFVDISLDLGQDHQVQKNSILADYENQLSKLGCALLNDKASNYSAEQLKKYASHVIYLESQRDIYLRRIFESDKFRSSAAIYIIRTADQREIFRKDFTHTSSNSKRAKSIVLGRVINFTFEVLQKIH